VVPVESKPAVKDPPEAHMRSKRENSGFTMERWLSWGREAVGASRWIEQRRGLELPGQGSAQDNPRRGCEKNGQHRFDRAYAPMATHEGVGNGEGARGCGSPHSQLLEREGLGFVYPGLVKLNVEAPSLVGTVGLGMAPGRIFRGAQGRP